jgi:hypothetical protein
MPTSSDFYCAQARSALAMHRHEAREFYIRVHGVHIYIYIHILYYKKMYYVKFEAALCISTSTIAFN